MQVLWAFKMEAAKVTRKESESIAILKDALLIVKLQFQRLYVSRSTTEHMRWYYKHQHEDGVLYNPLDGTV